MKLKVNKVQNNNYRTNFKGYIPKSRILKEAIETAVCNVKTSVPEQRNKTIQFFNTLRLIKNDGSNKKLLFTRIEDQYGYDIAISYGKVQDSAFGKFGYNELIDAVIELGNKLFGQEAVNSRPNEIKKALGAQMVADTMTAKASKAKTRANKAFYDAFYSVIKD